MNPLLTKVRSLALAIVAAVTLSLVVSGCGQEATIEQTDADAAIAALDGVELAYADGRCDVAQQRAESLGAQIDDLPSSTDRELRRALQRSTDRLTTLVSSQCEAPPEPVEPTEPVSDVAPIEPEKPKKEKKQKDKEQGNGQPPEEAPPNEEPPPEEDDGSGGVGPGEDGVLE